LLAYIVRIVAALTMEGANPQKAAYNQTKHMGMRLRTIEE